MHINSCIRDCHCAQFIRFSSFVHVDACMSLMSCVPVHAVRSMHFTRDINVSFVPGSHVLHAVRFMHDIMFSSCVACIACMQFIYFVSSFHA